MKRPKTYNDILSSVINYEYVIAIREGEAVYLKNRGGDSKDKIEPSDFILFMMRSLPKTGVKFFDDALKEELTNAIAKILFKHNIL